MKHIVFKETTLKICQFQGRIGKIRHIFASLTLEMLSIKFFSAGLGLSPQNIIKKKKYPE